ncbi:MAG: DMT family transporter, partial [Acetobacteraceae bacterium]
MARQRLLFVVLCLVWGTTWLALKVGVTAVPPAFFSGTRWTVAGLALLAWRRWRGQRVRLPHRALGRAALVGVLMVALNAVLMLYGLRYVSSGLAAVISSALTPIALLGFSVAFGHEPFRPRQLAAIGLGVLGIGVLFGPAAAEGPLGLGEALGAAGVIAGTLCYTLGSVLARPLMRSVAPADVAALTNLIGGGMLLPLSLAFEPGAWHAAGGDWGTAAWAAWLFLLLPGSLGATIIYLILVRDWGASRTGTYAFVSPVFAVFLGVAFQGEQVDASSALGMALMLAAAGVVLLG